MESAKKVMLVLFLFVTLFRPDRAHSFGRGNNSNVHVPPPPIVVPPGPPPGLPPGPPPVVPPKPPPPPPPPKLPPPPPPKVEEPPPPPRRAEPAPVPVPKKVVFQLRCLFDVDKTHIKPEFNQHLQDAADFMRKHLDAVINVEGHADKDGNSKANIQLAQKRAEAVRNHLIKLGVNPVRIKHSAHSDERPFKPNDTKANKAENRRVVGNAEAFSVGDELELQGFTGRIR